MMTYAEALALIDDAVDPLAAVQLPFGNLIGCASSELHASRMPVPGFANAAMDGFALRATETASAAPGTPLLLKVSGTVVAGDPPIGAPPVGTVIEIMTGAAMPHGCDAVIPVERVEVQRAKNNERETIRIETPMTPGQNVRAAGEDYAIGQTVLSPGRIIEPHDVMALAATGTDEIRARTAVRIAILTTGTELAGPGSPEQGGMIRDANGPYLEAFIAHTGARLANRCNVPDEVAALDAALGDLTANADMILTTGGVSAGRYDLVPDAIRRAGGEIIFHKVAIRPGKPLLFARLRDGTLLFGLPGNPIAVAVCMRFFVVPALRRLQGLAAEQYHAAVTDEDIRKRPDIRFFGKAVAGIDAGGQLRTRLLPGQESFKIHPLSAANSWAIIPEGRERISAGELIQVAPLYPTGFLQSPV